MTCFIPYNPSFNKDHAKKQTNWCVLGKFPIEPKNMGVSFLDVFMVKGKWPFSLPILCRVSLLKICVC